MNKSVQKVVKKVMAKVAPKMGHDEEEQIAKQSKANNRHPRKGC